MDVECWRDQVEQRLLRRQLSIREISEARKFCAGVVPLDSRPVIEALQGQVDVFVGFEFDDGEAAVAGGGQHVEHGAVGGGECGNLRIELLRLQALVDDADVGDDQGFEPALGAQAKQRVLARAVGMAGVADGGEKLQEEREVGVAVLTIEHALFSADAENDFLLAAERGRFGAHAGACKLEAAPAEGEFGGREHGDLAVGQNRVDAGYGVGETFERGGFVGGVDQAGGDVAPVAAIDFHQGIVAPVQFKQAPLGGGAVQVGHALSDERGTALRDE